MKSEPTLEHAPYLEAFDGAAQFIAARNERSRFVTRPPRHEWLEKFRRGTGKLLVSDRPDWNGTPAQQAVFSRRAWP